VKTRELCACGGWGLDQNLRKQSCEQIPYASLKALLEKPNR